MPLEKAPNLLLTLDLFELIVIHLAFDDSDASMCKVGLQPTHFLLVDVMGPQHDRGTGGIPMNQTFQVILVEFLQQTSQDEWKRPQGLVVLVVRR